MEIISYPENYSGVHSPVIYTVAVEEPQQVLRAEITDDSGQILGIKRFRGESTYDINIAPYIGARLKCVPFSEGVSGFYPCPERSVAASLHISAHTGQQITSEARRFTAGVKSGVAGEPLSSSPKQIEISTYEFDEIPFIAPGMQVEASIRLTGRAGEKTFVIGQNDQADAPRFECLDGIYAFIVNVSHILEIAGAGGIGNYSVMSVKINGFAESSGESQLIAEREYRLRESGRTDVRLCWENSFGCVDYHTFSACVSEKLSADSKKIYTQEGYTVIHSETEVAYELVSGPETGSTMRWLAGITCAPQAWIVKDDGFLPVDIVTDKVTIKDGDPAVFTVTVREKLKREYNKN